MSMVDDNAVVDNAVAPQEPQEPQAPVAPVAAQTAPAPVKKIVFALPGDNFSSKFLIAWTATISKLWETRRYDIMISPATGSYVPF